MDSVEVQYPRKRPKSAALKSFIKPGGAGSSSQSREAAVGGRVEEKVTSNRPSKAEDEYQNMSSPYIRDGHSVLGEIYQNRSPGGRQSLKKLAARDNSMSPTKNGWSPWRFQARANSADLPSKIVASSKDKENTTPPRASATQDTATPIWAQFASGSSTDESTTRRTSKSMSPTKMTTEVAKNDSLSSTGTVKRRANNRMNLSPSKQSYRGDNNFQSPERGRTRQRGNPYPLDYAGSTPGNSSKVKETVALFNSKSDTSKYSQKTRDSAELDAALEAVLVAQNIPQKIRENMRNVDAKIKEDFIKNADSFVSKTSSANMPTPNTSPQKSRLGTSSAKLSTMIRGRSSSKGPRKEQKHEEEQASPTKRGRSWSRALAFGRGENSPQKRPRSMSRPRSLTSLKNFSSSSVNSLGVDGSKDSKDQGPVLTVPEDFIKYLQEDRIPQNVEVGKLHKLRILLRNEAVSWVDQFIAQGGMNELVGLLERVLQIEWREEHEDLLLHEVLLCLKALCTTQKALDKLTEIESTLIPHLLQMLFDKERKGPSEFTTRGIVITIIFNYLAAAPFQNISVRAKGILTYLSDQLPPENERPVGFVDQMRQPRPYQTWCKEISNVTKEVFWIFLHHQNVVPLPSIEGGSPDDKEAYIERHFPRERPPVPAAPYVGGVEWDATNYLGVHLDLLNGLVASFETKTERNQLREELKASSFEKLMGGTLRLCKEKFYGAVHEGLKTWVSAANEDSWDVTDVRNGPKSREIDHLRIKGPSKMESPPKLNFLPDFNLDAGQEVEREKVPLNDDGYGWI